MKAKNYSMLSPLPIDNHIPQLKKELQKNPRLILIATPGAGKSTRVPPAFLQQESGKILLVEPRRTAAKMLAHRISEEQQSHLGSDIGYQIRFDNQTRKDTKLIVATEGIVLQRLRSDPFL